MSIEKFQKFKNEMIKKQIRYSNGFFEVNKKDEWQKEINNLSLYEDKIFKYYLKGIEKLYENNEEQIERGPAPKVETIKRDGEKDKKKITKEKKIITSCKIHSKVNISELKKREKEHPATRAIIDEKLQMLDKKNCNECRRKWTDLNTYLKMYKFAD